MRLSAFIGLRHFAFDSILIENFRGIRKLSLNLAEKSAFFVFRLRIFVPA